MYSIRPYQAYSFSCWFFPTTPFDPSPKDTFSSSFVAEVGIFFYILLSQWSIFYFFLPEELCCCSLQPFFLFLLGHCSFRAYPFNRSVVSFCSSFFILSSLSSLFNQNATRIGSSFSSFLTECFQLCSSPLFYFFQFVQPFQGSLVSFVCQRST